MAVEDVYQLLKQQSSLAFVLAFMAALYTQGHFQSRTGSKRMTGLAGASLSGALCVLVLSACATTFPSSHESFKWSFAAYSAVSLIFDCLLIGRLNDLYTPSGRLEVGVLDTNESGFVRRKLVAVWRLAKSCPPSFTFHLVQGTAVVGLIFRSLEDLNEFLKPQLIGTHAQAAKRLEWLNVAMVHLRAAAVLEAAIMIAFLTTVYILVMRLSSKTGDLPANRKSWVALLIATMLMTMRATSNAVIATCNPAISGEPIIDSASVLFWFFDVLPVLCSYALMFFMVDDNDSHEFDRELGYSSVSEEKVAFDDEKMLIIPAYTS